MRALWAAALLLTAAPVSAWAQDEPASRHPHHKIHKPEASDAEAEPAPRHPHSHHKPHQQPATDSADNAAPDEESEHVVRAGETLGGVAVRAKVPRILIAEANGLKRPYHLHAGERLKLPRTRHHTVRPGETGFDIAYRYGVPFSAIAVANGLKPDGELKTGQDLLIPTLITPGAAPIANAEPAAAADAEDRGEPTGQSDEDHRHAHDRFTWPLTGKVTRGFRSRGKADYHDGIDITAEPGTAVRAAAAGTVIFAGREPQNFGNLVVIDHGHGWQSAYGFLDRITLHKGDEVHTHERLGTVDHTGKARHDELHFELRKHNKPVDPMDELPDQAKAQPVEPAARSHHHRNAQNTVPDAR